MELNLERIEYRKLNARQKENYNYQKLSAVLADFGFMTIRLSDDWAGADFIAQHISGEVLKVQLKGRFMLAEKYVNRNLWIAFRSELTWYLYPHDILLKRFQATSTALRTSSWQRDKSYSWPQLTQSVLAELKPYRLN